MSKFDGILKIHKELFEDFIINQKVFIFVKNLSYTGLFNSKTIVI